MTREEEHALRWALRHNDYSIGAHASQILARLICRTRPELDGLEQSLREGPAYPWTRSVSQTLP